MRHADWRERLRGAVRSPDELQRRLHPARALPAGAGEAHARFPVLVPPAFEAAIRSGSKAVLRQIEPSASELVDHPGFVADPVADLASTVAPGVLHKYSGRVLLIATGACAVHCRYCFRRHFPYDRELAARNDWQAAVDYIAEQPSVREVILSGGDPLTLSNEKLARLTARLANLPHVRRLRIHSRMPVALPERFEPGLLDWLAGLPMQRVLVLHANHADELTPAARDALADLGRTGTRLLNQAVLLRGVNDTATALVQLGEALFEAGVLPYYLHQLDRVAGAAHFEVPDEEALRLMDEVRRRSAGFLVPRLVRERPGATSKVPVL